MQITIEQIEEQIRYFVERADLDAISLLVCDLFGGDCTWINGDVFTFTPNENYGGAFDEYSETNEVKGE